MDSECRKKRDEGRQRMQKLRGRGTRSAESKRGIILLPSSPSFAALPELLAALTRIDRNISTT